MYGYTNFDYKDKDAENKNLIKSIVAFIILIVFVYIIVTYNINSDYKDNYEDQTLYIISFDTKTSNPLESMVILKNEQINLPTLEKDNYTFTGWVDENDNPINNPYTVDGDATLVASWVRNDYETYKVSFDLNGGYGTIETQKIKEGTTASKPNTPKKEGYTFAGWYYNGKVYNFDTKVNTNMILTAKWKVDTNYRFDIKFSLNNGTGQINTQKVKTEGTVTKPSNPTRSGYSFKGWYLNGQKYNFNTKVTSEFTLVAYWESDGSNSEYYRVAFDVNGGKKQISTQLVMKGRAVERPNNPLRDGYLFVGWYLNGKEYNFKTPVTSHITLEAKWRKNASTTTYYTVKFDENTGDTKVATQKVAAGGTVTEPEDPKKEGFVFLGWYYNGRLYDFDKKVTKNMVLGAAWRSYSKTKYYVVMFDTNGGSGTYENQNIQEGGTATKPKNPTRSGYTFKGWYLNGLPYDFSSPVTQGFELIAMWESEKATYNVWFNLNGGSGNISVQRVLEGETATKPSNPTRSGYTFSGWYLGDTKYDFTEGVTKDITISAKWTKNSSATTYYVVTFDADGGSSVYSQNVVKGAKATKPSNPTRSGYTFKGWYLNGSLFDFDTNITSNITLLAVWTKNDTIGTTQKHVVNFLSNGGSSVSSQSIASGKTAVEPTEPTRSGYTFLGWYTSNKIEYNFKNKVTSNVTLYALWAPKLNYKMNSSGKWIFVNNPETLGSLDYFADSDYGNHLLYKTSFSGNVELYYEHGVADSYINKFYYAIRIYNPNSTSTTLKINKCGASMGWGATEVWKQYYDGSCSIAGNTFIIPAKKSVIIYHNGTTFFYGSSDDVSSISKVSSSAFDGVLNMTSSDTLYIANLIFKDITKTYTAVYEGNYTENLGTSTTARVYSGEYNKLPIQTHHMTYEIYDETPSGVLPVSYTATDGKTYITGEDYSWDTNLIGGKIDTKKDYTPVYLHYQHVSDFVKLNVPTSSGSITLGPYKKYSEKRDLIHGISKTSMLGWPYNWGNWAVHYKENITIKNNSSSTKKVTLNLVDVSNQTIIVYHNGKVTGYNSGDNKIWTISVTANSSKTVSSIFLLGGHSNGKITKELVLS